MDYSKATPKIELGNEPEVILDATATTSTMVWIMVRGNGFKNRK